MYKLAGKPEQDSSLVAGRRIVLVSNVVSSAYIADVLRREGMLAYFVSPVLLRSRVFGGRRAVRTRVNRRYCPRLRGVPLRRMAWYELVRRLLHSTRLSKRSIERALSIAVDFRYRRLLSRADVLYIHSAVSTELVKRARRAGMTIIVDHRSRYPGPDEPSVVEDELLIEFTAADVIIVNSDLVAEEFIARGYSSSRVRVVELAADTSVFFPSLSRQPRDSHESSDGTSDVKQVLFVGSLSRRKGVDLLLGAASLVEHATAQFTLVGHRSKDLDIDPLPMNVTVMATQSPRQLAELYRATDLFILPSRSDAFGLVAVEAAACGAPLMLSADVGARQSLSDVCDVATIQDLSAQGIADQLVELLADRSRLAEMATSARQAHEAFGWHHYEVRLTAAISAQSSEAC